VPDEVIDRRLLRPLPDNTAGISDETGKITVTTEAARLTREGIPSPSDRRAQLFGRPVKGGPWTAKIHTACSYA
jgi:hypothetical protein